MEEKKDTVMKSRQTELWSDFKTIAAEVEDAMASLKRAHEALVALGPMPKEIVADVTKTTTRIEENAKELRERLNKVVHRHALERGLHFNEVWRLLYSRLREAIGFDAIARSLGRKARGKEQPYLDEVQEAGHLGKLLDLAIAF